MTAAPSLHERSAGVKDEFGVEEATPLVGWVSKAIGGACMVLLGGITLTVLLQVAMRYIFDSPLTWTDEFTRIQLVWLAFLGAALAYRVGGDIAVDLLRDTAEQRGLNWLSRWSFVVVQGAIVVGAALFVASGSQLVQSTSTSTTPALGAPMSIFYLPVVVSGALVLFSVAERFVRHRRKRKD